MTARRSRLAKRRRCAARAGSRHRRRPLALGAGVAAAGGSVSPFWRWTAAARGRSGDADDYALEREFEDVAAVVERAGEGVSLLGHSHGGVCALEAALRTDRVRRLVVYEPPLGFLATPADVVARLKALLDAGKRDELLAYFMREVAGLSAEQVEMMRSLPAWEKRLAAAPTIPREDRANREYAFDPERFRGLQIPTLFLGGGDSPD